MSHKDSSFSDFIVECDKLLDATEEHADVLPSAGPYRTSMQELVTQVKDVRTRQHSLVANRQAATQDLGALIKQCRVAITRLRSAVRADLGPHSELLVQFGVAPQRPRKRRPQPSDGAPEPPAPTPEAQAPGEPNA
jgi:hypothetical protein